MTVAVRLLFEKEHLPCRKEEKWWCMLFCFIQPFTKTFAMAESVLTWSFTQTLIDLIWLSIPNFHSEDCVKACKFYVTFTTQTLFPVDGSWSLNQCKWSGRLYVRTSGNNVAHNPNVKGHFYCWSTECHYQAAPWMWSSLKQCIDKCLICGNACKFC